MIDARAPLSCAVLIALVALSSGCTSLLRATRDNDRATVARLLRAGDDPNEVATLENDKKATTPLFEAIAQHDMELVHLLVEGGANVNLESNCEEHVVTPLQKAALHGDVAIVRYLLAKGADPMGLGEKDNVLEWLALRPGSGTPAERRAIVRAVVQHAEKLGPQKAHELLDGQTPSGWSPLTLAVYRNDPALVEVLLERGASVNALAKARPVDGNNSDEWPPIHFAIILERPEIVALLTKAGASRAQKSWGGKNVGEVLADIETRRQADAEWAAEMAQRREENDRADEQQRAASFQAFQQGLSNGLQKSSSNPVDDNSFQERMQALIKSEGAKKAAQQERERAQQAEAAAEARRAHEAARSNGSGGSGRGATSAGAAAIAGRRDNQSGQEDEARKREEARRQEAAQKELARQDEEARSKGAARKKEEERQEESARKKAEAEAGAIAAKEAERRAWQDYLDAMRRGIRLRATVAFCTDGMCATGERPKGGKSAGSGCIDVSFRASCVSTLSWSAGTLYNFVGMTDTAPITPKPPCEAKDVRVEVTDVRGCR